MEDLCIGLRLLVPGACDEFEVENSPVVYLVQKHYQQDADNDDGAAGEQELLTTEQRAAHDIE